MLKQFFSQVFVTSFMIFGSFLWNKNP